MMSSLSSDTQKYIYMEYKNSQSWLMRPCTHFNQPGICTDFLDKQIWMGLGVGVGVAGDGVRGWQELIVRLSLLS